jgi:eukaryotic-like serine/threonine-protein kinase
MRGAGPTRARFSATLRGMTTLGRGSTVDRYRLVAPAGEGGQGSIWRAEDPLHPDTPVALKLVPIGAAPSSSLERFRREARSLAHLSHPSLPRCHALFEDLRHDVVGIALDFIEGSPLSVLLASESLTKEHRVWILRHLTAALGYIHEAGLVHRDVKPQNVMIVEGFTEHPADPAGVKLVDFGIAAESHNPQPITMTGTVTGTVDYLAPEIVDRTFWKEERDGPERDVFALGVLAFELLRGHHPTGLAVGTAPGDLMLAYRAYTRDGGWPPDVEGDPLEAFYRKSLALRVADRARNGAELGALLDDVEAASVRVGGSAPGRRAAPRARRAQAPVDTGRTGPVTSTVSPASVLSRRRSNKLIAGFVTGGAALFSVSFYVTYSRPFNLPRSRAAAELLGTARPNLDAEEPPNPTEPARPSRPAPPATRPTGVPLAASGAAAPSLPIGCPSDMIAIPGPPPFCIDRREVSVTEYRQCAACGAAKEAYWSGATATESALKEQTTNCTNGRVGLEGSPINCVSWQDATAYCAGVQKRLPRMAEWRAAKGSIALCSEVGGACPMFEWSSDPGPLEGYRATRGPSFRHSRAPEGTNIEAARNDDLGFRCARDPAAK